MFLYPNNGLTPSLEQMAYYHPALAAQFEYLKLASKNNSSVFPYYGGLHSYHLSLEHHDKKRVREQTIQANPNDQILFDLLREGGYILYARHGEATVGEDQANLHYNYCFTQRNLSNFGKIQAITFGQALRHSGIPIQYPVLASPFCRTRETAELAFGRENVQVDPFWVKVYDLSGDVRSGEQRRIIDSINSALESKPIPGYNKVIIAHSFPGNNGLGEIPDMGTVVLKSYGEGKGYEIIARLSLSRLTVSP